jgi:uncharacterized membrane protein YraQ (UPF0718 family)
MDQKKELKILFWIVAVFAFAFFLPTENEKFNTAIAATLDLVKWYAQEHVILCLLPAFFIAGVISVFVSRASVLKYFGAQSKKWVAMSLIYRREEKAKREEQMNIAPLPEKRPLWQTSLHFFTLVLILVFANWGKPAEGDTTGTWYYLWHYKWWITGFFGIVLGYSLIKILKIKWQWVLGAFFVTVASVILSNNLIESSKMKPLVPMLVGIIALSVITVLDEVDEDNKAWTIATWDFAKQILPLLAGPSLSLPNMLVIRGIMGTNKTVVYVSLVVVMATITGIIYGTL